MATYQATTKSAEAPDIEADLYEALFDRTEQKRVKGGQYTKDNVNGDPKLEWFFTLLDEDGDVLYADGDPVEVSKLTGVGFNIASKTVPGEVRMLKALLTPAEYAAFENGEGTPDDTVDAPEGLKGRKVQVEVFINDKGWPAVGNVIAAKKSRKAKAVSAE